MFKECAVSDWKGSTAINFIDNILSNNYGIKEDVANTISTLIRQKLAPEGIIDIPLVAFTEHTVNVNITTANNHYMLGFQFVKNNGKISSLVVDYSGLPMPGVTLMGYQVQSGQLYMGTYPT